MNWARSKWAKATDYTRQPSAASACTRSDTGTRFRTCCATETLARTCWKINPQLQHLMLHNIDTLGANVDPSLLGLHIHGVTNGLSF